MKLSVKAPSLSVRTKLMILLLGMAAAGLIAIAAMAIISAQSASRSAQMISSRILRAQAEETLVQVTRSIAKENDLILERVSRDTKKIAAYAANIFSNPADFHNPAYYSVWEHMQKGADGQFMNGEDDLSSVFVPLTTQVDAQVIRDIEISAYLDLVLKATLESNPNVDAIYFATPRDVVRYYPNINLGAVLPPDFQATKRVWYAGTVERGAEQVGPWWTPAYLDATGLGIITTAAAPAINDQGEILGVVGFDVTLTEMKSGIEARKTLPGGYSFLIDDSGRAIALPNQGYLDILGRPPNTGEFGTDLSDASTAFAPVIASMLSGESGFESIQVDRKELFIAYAPMKSASWSLGSVIEAQEVLKSVSRLREDMEATTHWLIFRRILPVSGVVFILVLLLGWLMTNQLVRPIQKLATAAEEIKSGNWEAELPETRNDEIGVLAQAFAGMTGQLHDLVMQLEQRVAARTADLEQRAVQLQAAADVGHAAASLRNPDELLGQVTHLISERFDFYHVGVFLLDDAEEYAVLRAANSAGGQQLLALGHKLKVGQQGIVGYVTGSGKPRIALDVGEDAVHFQNPYLPETRSEMALPLLAGGELLGVIDVQSKIESAFSPEDIEVLQVLADQVAVALHNAHLFQELQNSLRETKNLYKLHSQEAWSRLSAEKKMTSFKYDRLQVAHAEPKQLSAELVERLHEGQILILPAQEKDNPNTHSRLIAPIMVHGQAIGLIGFERVNPEQTWLPEEITLIETISGQVALTLENVRLLEETQSRAERERLVAEITSRMRETLDMETILQTALQEIGDAMQLQEVMISFEPALQPSPERLTDSQPGAVTDGQR